MLFYGGRNLYEQIWKNGLAEDLKIEIQIPISNKNIFIIIFLGHGHDDQRAMGLVCIERALRFRWSFDVRLRYMCGRWCNLFWVRWLLLENFLQLLDCRYFHCRRIEQEFHLHCSWNRFQQLSCLLNGTRNILIHLLTVFKHKPTHKIRLKSLKIVKLKFKCIKT